MGPHARTPEAVDLWLDWSDGRSQTSQTSLSVWQSAINQPLRFGPLGLIKLVRSLVPAPNAAGDFPDDQDEEDDDEPPEGTPPATPIWDAINARWAFCATKGFIDTLHGIVLSRQGFADKHARVAHDLRRELRLRAGGKPPSVADIFLSRKDRREVLDLTYAPGDPRFPATIETALPLFNRWTPTAIAPLDIPADITLWLDHLLYVLGSVAERDRFLRWCAFVAQCPGLKPNWHYLIMSLQGVGKDTMLEPVKLSVGDKNWIEALSHQLADNFNDIVEHKLMIIGETAQPKSGSVSAHDLSTRMKPLLAQPPTHQTVNRKFLQPYQIPNRCAVILFSNESNPLYLERGQRRVHVVNRLGAVVQPPAYYQKLQHWLQTGGAALAAAYLMTLPLSDAEKQEFIGGVAPESDDKTELENQNTHPQLAALEDLIRDARAGIVDGTPKTLVATIDQLCALIKAKGLAMVSPQNVRTWLLDMEKRGQGVRRLKIDPKEPHHCAVVSARLAGILHHARLWLLADVNPDGQAWSTMTTAEIIALWKSLPKPPSASVSQHPKAAAKDAFPDDAKDEDEPV